VATEKKNACLVRLDLLLAALTGAHANVQFKTVFSTVKIVCALQASMPLTLILLALLVLPGRINPSTVMMWPYVLRARVLRPRVLIVPLVYVTMLSTNTSLRSITQSRREIAL
jgi:hypothetical protein